MPLVTIDVIKNVFTPINEFESGDWAIGGKALQSTDVQALAAGQAA